MKRTAKPAAKTSKPAAGTTAAPYKVWERWDLSEGDAVAKMASVIGEIRRYEGRQLPIVQPGYSLRYGDGILESGEPGAYVVVGVDDWKYYEAVVALRDGDYSDSAHWGGQLYLRYVGK